MQSKEKSMKSTLQFTNSNQIDPMRQQCSLQTLQQDPIGHFAQIVEHLRKSTGNYVNVLLQMSQLKNDYDRIQFASSIEGMVIFLPAPVFKPKSDQEAKEARQQGNAHYKKGQVQKAFMHYSVAVIKSVYPKPDEESTMLAYSLGNRSACLVRMEMFKEAIDDIQLALSLNYPKEDRHKLYERLGKAYMAIGETAKARGAFLIFKELTQDEEKFSALMKSESNQSQPLLNDIDVLIMDKQNDTFEALSSKVTIKSDTLVGRHTIAQADIGAYETVLSEEAYSVVLYPDKFGLNCAHCLRRLKVAIPCKHCSRVAFCSIQCRDDAWNSFHQWECPYLDVLIGFGCSALARLALRIITSKPVSFFVQKKQEILDGVTENSGKDKYLQILSLVALEEQRWPEDFVLRSSMALILLGILRSSGYFGSKKTTGGSDSYTKNELFIGSLLLKHLQILQFNAHEIHEVLRQSPVNLKPSKNVPIALGIYPTASFINHSCHGNLARCFQGSRMVLKALTSIKALDEVCDNYGPTFYFKNRSQRKQELSSRYWFDCQCKACVGNWPILQKLPKNPKIELTLANSLIEGGRIEEIAKVVRPYLTEDNLKPIPSDEYIRAQDILRRCVNNHGNVIYVNKQ